MRRINTSRFRVATRGTSRAINSQIVLNLVRAHQPISRADLARTMGVGRGAVTLIVNDLLRASADLRGRDRRDRARPQADVPLHRLAAPRRRGRSTSAPARPIVMLADLLGKPLAGVTSFPTVARSQGAGADAGHAHQGAARRASRRRRLRGHRVVVPGHGRALDDDACCTRRRSAGATSICARRWPPPPGFRCRSRTPAAPVRWRRRGRCAPTSTAPRGDLVFVSVSDGVGVGVIINGEVLRGRHNIAGEFGHVPLSLDGPRCSCGSNGCWEAYVSNRATLARYFGRPASAEPPRRTSTRAHFTIDDLIARARARRRQGGRRDRGDGALSRVGPGVGDQRPRSRPGSTSAARSRWPGT